MRERERERELVIFVIWKQKFSIFFIFFWLYEIKGKSYVIVSANIYVKISEIVVRVLTFVPVQTFGDPFIFMINELDLKSGISSFTISLGNASCGLILIEFTAVAKDSI